MKIYEVVLDDALLEQLIAMSADWASENSTYGYYPNTREDIAGNRIFVAETDQRIVGYLLGKTNQAERTTSVMREGTVCFEVEELYVVPEKRSCGVGKSLFQFVENVVRREGVSFMDLITATKNHRRILHFYIDELGMEFWSARLYKKL